MHTTQNARDDWQACRDGEIVQLVDQLKRRRRQAVGRNAALAGVLLAIMLLGGYTLLGLGRPTKSVHAGMACGDVMQHAEEYLAGKLDAEMAEHIRQHLEECPTCRQKIAAMRLHSDHRPADKPEAIRDDADGSGSPVVRRTGGLQPVMSVVGW